MTKLLLRYFVPFIVCLTIVACKSSIRKRPSPIAHKGDTASNAQIMDEGHHESPSDCTGAIPSSAIIRSVFPKTKFILSKDSLTGYETVYLPNGDEFLITIGNCDYHSLYFTFNSIHSEKDTSDKKFWYNKGIDLMQGILNGLEDSVLVAGGIKCLKHYIDTAKNMRIDDEIDFDYIDSTDFHSMVNIDTLRKAGNNNYSLDIMFSEGPL